MITIFPGETEQCEIYLPFAASMVRKVIISFQQDDDVILEIEETSARDAGESRCLVIHRMTQTESLQLQNLITCKVQVNVYTNYGDRIVSIPDSICVGEQLHRKRITE